MAKFEVYKDPAGEYRWRFKAGNGQIIADSAEGYKAKADCLAGIAFVKKYAASAEVEDLTVAPSYRTAGYGPYRRW